MERKLNEPFISYGLAIEGEGGALHYGGQHFQTLEEARKEAGITINYIPAVKDTLRVVRITETMEIL